MTVGNTVHKKSNSCSYYSAFTSTFFLGKSGKSDIEGLFPKKSPSKRYHFFQTIFSHFFAAALDTLPVTHPSFTWSHVSLRLLSGVWRGSALQAMARWPRGRAGGEMRSCSHPHTSHCKINAGAGIPILSQGTQNDGQQVLSPHTEGGRPSVPKSFPKEGGGGVCEGSHSKHMFCHVIPEDWHFGEGPTEREIGWLHKQPFCLLLYLLLLSFPHKLTLTKITLKQEKIIVSATMKIISGIMCTLVFSLKHKGITAFLLFLFSMLSLIKP